MNAAWLELVFHFIGVPDEWIFKYLKMLQQIALLIGYVSMFYVNEMDI